MRIPQLRKEQLEASATDFVVRLAFLGLFAWCRSSWCGRSCRSSSGPSCSPYPAYAWLARRLGDRKGLAATLLTLVALATVLGPVSVLGTSLAESVYWLATSLNSGTLKVPPPPPGVADWPVIGDKLNEAWALAAANLDEAVHRYGASVLPIGGTLLAKVADLGLDMLKFVASVIIAGFLFVPGPRLGAGARAFAARLVAPRGAQFVDLAGATIRNVSRGVIGVALLQALLAGIILYVAGIPGAGLIAFSVLILCIIQIGAAPVLLPVLVWVWMTQPPTFSLILTVLLVPVALIDNVLKPILMARGLTTPMLVILTGVIGGTLTHGLVGLFLGPVVLSVFYELVVAWTRLGASPAAAPDAGQPEQP